MWGNFIEFRSHIHGGSSGGTEPSGAACSAGAPSHDTVSTACRVCHLLWLLTQLRDSCPSTCTVHSELTSLYFGNGTGNESTGGLRNGHSDLSSSRQVRWGSWLRRATWSLGLATVAPWLFLEHGQHSHSKTPQDPERFFKIPLTCFLSSFKSLLKCRLVGEAFPEHPSENCTPLPSLSLALLFSHTTESPSTWLVTGRELRRGRVLVCSAHYPPSAQNCAW